MGLAEQTHALGHPKRGPGSPFSALLMLWRLCVLDLLKLGWVGFDGDVQTSGLGGCLVAASLSPCPREGIATASVPSCSSLKVKWCFMTKADEHV